MVGAGRTMLPGVYARRGPPMPDEIFKIIYLIGFVAGSTVRAVYTRHWKRNKITNQRVTVIEKLMIALAGVGLVFLPLAFVLTPWLDFADYHLPKAAGWVGAAVFAVAVWLLWRAHVDLGRNWSALLEIRDEHSLVTGGTYRYVRHPMYAAHWLWGVAQALMLANWIAGPALLVCFIPLYFMRVPREEQMMLEHFGEEYRCYVNQTGRIVPRLRRHQSSE